MQIIVLSRNPALYSTQSIVTAGNRRGHQMRVVDHMQCDLVIERSKHQVYYQNERIAGVNAVIPRIGSSATSYGAAVIRQFESMRVFSTLNSQALMKSRDKLSSLQLLAAEGIGIPKSIVSNNPLVFHEILKKIENYPKIIKLVNATHGVGVILSENQQNAESILESFNKVKQNVIVQEYIKESKGTDIRFFVIENEVVAVMQRKPRNGEFRSNLHRGGTAVVLKPTDEEIYVAKKSARLMGLEIAGVDMLRSKRGPLVLEVNASPGLEGIEGASRVDIADKIIKYVERKANPSWKRK